MADSLAEYIPLKNFLWLQVKCTNLKFNPPWQPAHIRTMKDKHIDTGNFRATPQNVKQYATNAGNCRLVFRIRNFQGFAPKKLKI